MSLFPAYAAGDVVHNAKEQALSEVTDMVVVESRSSDASPAASPGLEHALLASDSEEECAPLTIRDGLVTSGTSDSSADYYVDCHADRGNLRVSTLYYPGRPEYLRPGPARIKGRGTQGKVRGKRYWKQGAGGGGATALAGTRAATYRRALADTPHDASLWLQYIDYRHCCGDGEAGALEAADEAVKAMPQESALRERQHEAARLALAPDQYGRRLRTALETEREPERRAELWVRLLAAAACAAGSDTAAVRAVAAAAADDTRAAPASYAALLHAHGGFLRSAGLWEELAQLVELVAAMAFPPGPFPPARDPALERRAEEQLAEYEERTMRGGLPAGEVWARVERARAAVHWRAPAGAMSPGALAADPQRLPAAADVAALLRPLPAGAGAARALATLLRLAEVPLMPAAEAVARAADPALAAHEWEAGGPPGVLALVRAARRLPPAHPARPAPGAARRLLALTPPRILADANGFGEWVDALWEAAARWAGSPRAREAVVCWRLRWLHGRALLQEADPRGTRRLRSQARALVEGPAASTGPAALAGYARVEAAAAGGRRGLHVGRAALRLAVTDPAQPIVDVLYLARVVGELAQAALGAAEAAAESRWALCCAVLRRALPPDTAAHPPDAALQQLALRQCEERCAALDAEGEEEAPLELWPAMLPGAAEWGAARAALAGQGRRVELQAELVAAGGVNAGSGRGRRAELTACALVAAAARDHSAALAARELLPLFPHNAYLAAMSAGCPLWSLGSERGLATMMRELAPPRADIAALATALPAMLRAVEPDCQPYEYQRAFRAVSRALRGGAARCGGWALWAWRLWASAQGGGPAPLGPELSLSPSLCAAPHAHALYAHAATLCPPAALTLPDLLLERQLRLHSLPAELSCCDDALAAR